MFLGAHLEAFVSVKTGLSQGGDRHCQSLLIPGTQSHHDVKKTAIVFAELLTTVSPPLFLGVPIQ